MPCIGSDPPRLNETKTINFHIWADGLLILSETETGLNKMFSNFKTYTMKNLIEVNLEKTKCMVFNKNRTAYKKNILVWKKKIRCDKRVQIFRVRHYSSHQFEHRPCRSKRSRLKSAWCNKN